jgi:hypothetical protein
VQNERHRGSSGAEEDQKSTVAGEKQSGVGENGKRSAEGNSESLVGPFDLLLSRS